MWRSYILFCSYFDLPLLPATSKSFSLYAHVLSRSMTIETIKNNLSAVKKLHHMHNIHTDEFDHIYLTDTVRALERLIGRPPNRKLPITPHLLRRIYSVLDLSKPKHAALWSSFLIAFFTFSRKSNVVPPSATSFDTSKHLTRGDIVFSQNKLIICFRWSKTNQFHSRVVHLPITHIPDSLFCPVQAFSNLIRLAPASQHSPAFSYATAPLRFLTYDSFTTGLKASLARIGIDHTRYSGHSFRRGGATLAFSSDVAGELIRSHGDWRSAAYLSYLEFDMQTKLSVTQLMCHKISSLPS